MITNKDFIWVKNSKYDRNEYARFLVKFHAKTGNNYKINIVSKSEYVIYLNGKFVNFGQYPGFKDLKFYDSLDISSFIKEENELLVIALSKNYDCSNHIADGKGVAFEVVDKNGDIIVKSNEDTLSCLDPNYRSGDLGRTVTPQLGYGYEYDFTKNECKYEKSVHIKCSATIEPRPIKKLELIRNEFAPIGKNIFDGGKELAGYLFFNIFANEEQDITIKYGEHIKDGNVRSIIFVRNFEFNFHLKKGENVFEGYFLRLGLRYLEVVGLKGKINSIGVNQAMYPHQRFAPQKIFVPKEIFDKSLYTIECCMHEHYEDCPWREQSQYTMDTRLQLLLTYDGFHEYDFPRASLRLMGHKLIDTRDTYSITSPCESPLAIPTYSLIYPLLVKEYFDRTNDISLIKEMYPNIKRMVEFYLNKMDKKYLLKHINNEWNFYEWSDGLDNPDEIGTTNTRDKYDLPLNAFMIISLENTAELQQILNIDNKEYLNIADKIRKAIHDNFLGEDGLFYSYLENGKKVHLSEYSNIFGVYVGATNEKEKEKILDVLTHQNDLIPLTLSNYVFKYEILLQNPKYDQYVIDEIKHIWGYMDKQGATTYWETIKGEADFDGAGSLCHGWSAVPAFVSYYLNKNR